MSNVAKVSEPTITDSVLAKVEKMESMGQLNLPSDYSAPNALKAAFLVLQETADKDNNKALQVCTKESIAMALLNMVVDGLSVAKKQCYFIVYGSKLNYEPSYMGKIALARRVAGVSDVRGQVVYDGDTFEYETDVNTGRIQVLSHQQNIDNINADNIKGAYAIVRYEDGTSAATVMSMVQIKRSWLQSSNKGNSPAHRNFPDQMAIRTVISRAIKLDIASSDDSYLNIESAPSQKEDAVSRVENQEIQEIEAIEIVDKPKNEKLPEGQVVEDVVPEITEKKTEEPNF